MQKDVDNKTEMWYKEYQWLKSEEHELEQFLKELPENDVFMRPGFLYRLEKVREKLKILEKEKNTK